MRIKDELLEIILEGVEALYGKKPLEEIIIETPPNIQLGDFAVGCFLFAKQFKKSPTEIAKELAKKLEEKNSDFAQFSAVGPYINLKIDNQKLFKNICREKLKPFKKNGQTVMVEYLSPNTNKPLHIGHLRNGSTGMAMSLILEFTGYNVVKANLVNDRGIHICKSMLAWQKFGKGATPESTGIKGDHFIGDYYVLFSEKSKQDPSLLDEVQVMLKKWEEGDPEVIKIWKMMNAWVLAGFKDSYKKIGLEFDIEYLESEIYKSGKEIVKEGAKRGILVEEDSGALFYMLPKKEFGENEDGTFKKLTLLRENGTSVYATQDIAVAAKKAIDYKLDASIYVVGEEQEYYFKTLFAALQGLGYSWADRCYHLAYGMVDLPDGKMKSREGNVIDADDLIKDVVALAKKEIRIGDEEKLGQREINSRATKISLGAIKFFLLRTGPKNKITFKIKESIAFDGFTGTYVQYAYTRAKGIVRKAESAGIMDTESSFHLIGNNPEERLLAQQIILFSEKIEKAAETYNPSVVANAVYNLAKTFHKFYNEHPVITEETELASQRLALISTTAKIIETGLGLLGIETLENM